MSVVMFSKNGVHFEGGPAGSIMALFVPTRDQVRAFPDLEGDNVNAISERYGGAGQKPLWRLERGQVVVYGTLLEELAERREELKVYLPEHILPPSVDVFYFIFGKEWMAHGVKTINDDGQAEWGISKIHVAGKDVTEVLVEAISERALTGGDEEYVIAVSQNDTAFNKLKELLKPFELDVVRFESLKPVRGAEPLYKHRNYSLVMMTVALLALMIVVITGGYWLVNRMERAKKQEEIERVRREIRSIQLNERIGYVNNPGQVLEKMSKPISLPPSAILHAVGDLGSSFGKLREVTFEIPQAQQGGNVNSALLVQSPDGQGLLLTTRVIISEMANKFLVDQENLAKTLIKEHGWLRDIKNVSSIGSSEGHKLDMVVRIK
jgi:hypothetical protein